MTELFLSESSFKAQYCRQASMGTKSPGRVHPLNLLVTPRADESHLCKPLEGSCLWTGSSGPYPCPLYAHKGASPKVRQEPGTMWLQRAGCTTLKRDLTAVSDQCQVGHHLNGNTPDSSCSHGNVTRSSHIFGQIVTTCLYTFP